MKKIYFVFVAISLLTTIYGQAPAGFKYQAIARNTAGQLITNTQVTIQIELLKDSIKGASVYKETFSPTTNNFGLVNLNIGSGTIVSGSFGTIDWGASTYFLKVSLNGTEMGTSQLLSVPYALFAKKADTVAHITITGSENAFTGWDKDTTDEFDGQYNSLIGAPNLSTVATSGSYSDLSNKPIPFDSLWTSLKDKPVFATIATSGSYTDLRNRPIPFDSLWTSLKGKPVFATVATSGSYIDLSDKPIPFDSSWTSLKGKPVFATIATSGSYADLSDKPILFDSLWTSIKAKPTTVTGYGITDAMKTTHVVNAIDSTRIANWDTTFSWGNHSGLYRPIDYIPNWTEITGKPAPFDSTWSAIKNKPAFATVATSGSYNDLTNKPEIPDTLKDLTLDAGGKTITNLADPVNSQDAATKAYVEKLLAKIDRLEKETGIQLKDFDGNYYQTINIGTQSWMAENLKTTHYTNGTAIPLVSDSTAWANQSTPAYCWYNNDSISYSNPYGALYNWYTVNTGMLCPTGWHVPDETEWDILINYLGGGSMSGGKLKETGNSHWASPNTGATNETGFTGLPGGFRYTNGFVNLSWYGSWWTTSEIDADSAKGRGLAYNNSSTLPGGDFKKIGISVRCVKN